MVGYLQGDSGSWPQGCQKAGDSVEIGVSWETHLGTGGPGGESGDSDLCVQLLQTLERIDVPSHVE